jgi:hypothetical protein
MKFWKSDGIAKKSRVFLTQPRQRRQVGSFRRRDVPLRAYLREGMLRSRPPEDVLAAIVIGNQRMLQAKPIGDGANACSFESPFGEFCNRGIEDRDSRLNRALAYYKVPGWICFADSLPLTATEKIQRGVLKEYQLRRLLKREESTYAPAVFCTTTPL